MRREKKEYESIGLLCVFHLLEGGLIQAHAPLKNLQKFTEVHKITKFWNAHGQMHRGAVNPSN